MKALTRIPAILLLLAVGIILGLLLGQLLPRDLLSMISGGGTLGSRATVILERVQALAQLTTIRYNYSLMVTSSRDMPPLLAGLYGESLSFVAVGHVTAGVDLALLQAKDIVEQNGILVITLPPPALQDCFLDEQQSYVVRRDTGLFANPSPALDNEARRFAIQQLRAAALEADILASAQQQAVTAVTQLAQAFGQAQVQLNSTPPDPNAPLPLTCG
ncbi:MAG: DUF4230 domain-containing protein [Chloroflexi bacterium]|nr:DUF4230 domain-containing protein [Chloroflexota bacterium]